jgi:CheY-like chemotaxis protein
MENETQEIKKPLILVVEDDSFIASVHSKKLTKEGFEVMMAGDGEEALEVVRKRKPDIIFLDLIMPKKDGFETLKELKTDPDLKDIKVIVLSNLSQEDDKQRVLDMGALDYVVKANVSFREIIDLAKNNV